MIAFIDCEPVAPAAEDIREELTDMERAVKAQAALAATQSIGSVLWEGAQSGLRASSAHAQRLRGLLARL